MITGFNTEIPYGGTVYHVQTEDMGHRYHRIITHVFQGGAILMSKKTDYTQLVAEGYDETKVLGLMQEQHRTIIRVIQSGKLEVLQSRIKESESQDDTAETPSAEQETASAPKVEVQAESAPPPAQEKVPPPSAPSAEAPAAADGKAAPTDSTLHTMLRQYVEHGSPTQRLRIEMDTQAEILAGQPALIRLRTKDTVTGDPLPECKVVVKVVGMTFRPLVFSGRTDPEGYYTLNLIIPDFTVGQAAILVKASSDAGLDELKLKVSRRV